jgi:thiamine-monophosphate kinase
MTRPVEEDEVLERIRGMVGNGIEAFGLRDDAAVLDLDWGTGRGSVGGTSRGPGVGRPLLASVDSVVEGVHVDLALCSPGDVGWKALMGALSDLAAMGAAPLGALVALCVPGGSGEGDLALGVMAGVAEASAAAGCPVVGGDVSGSDVLMVAVTVLGAVPDGDGGPPPVGRSGALPGDVLLVTGPCGGSAAGLRELRAGRGGSAAADAYRRPVARLREGELARMGGAHAMIDVSDGLALDLHRLSDASGVGFVLDRVPVAPDATLDEALGGGEDYELLVALGAQQAHGLSAAFASSGLRPPVSIGSVVAETAVRVLAGRDLDRMGWRHRLG